VDGDANSDSSASSPPRDTCGSETPRRTHSTHTPHTPTAPPPPAEYTSAFTHPMPHRRAQSVQTPVPAPEVAKDNGSPQSLCPVCGTEASCQCTPASPQPFSPYIHVGKTAKHPVPRGLDGASRMLVDLARGMARNASFDGPCYFAVHHVDTPPLPPTVLCLDMT
jgi:hypothetical protein